MPYEHKPNSGSLFKNEKKEKPNQPDYRGSCVITPDMVGKQIDIAAWLKESKNGKKFMSLAFSEPYNKPVESQAPKQAPAFDDGSDIPF